MRPEDLSEEDRAAWVEFMDKEIDMRLSARHRAFWAEKFGEGCADWREILEEIKAVRAS